MTCQCGCGQRTKLSKRNRPERGHVLGQPLPYLQGHRVRENSWRHEVDPESGCWMWQGTVGGNGYGNRMVKGRVVLAHRFEYERERGPVPDGMHLHHLCEAPTCVNPAHLKPVTQQEHRRLHATKLTAEDAAAIRRRLANETQAHLAREYSVSPSMIWMISAGRTWQ